MEDVYNNSSPSQPKPQQIKEEKERSLRDNDVLTWSTPPKPSTESRKKDVQTSFKDSPLVTFNPPKYEEPEQVFDNNEQLQPFTPQERNQLIHAFLGNSISSQQFKQSLFERVGIKPTESLDIVSKFSFL